MGFNLAFKGLISIGHFNICCMECVG